MLWLALHFPALPLDVFRRAANSDRSFAVSSADGAHRLITACNRSARTRGVTPGMTVAAATALDGELRILPRDTVAEQAALERLAAWALQFTPVVSLTTSGTLLLEVEGSLRLFTGLGALQQRIAEGVRALGYRAVMATAPTPLAAEWFAVARLPVRIRHADALEVSLQQLPVKVLGLERAAHRLLDELGLATVGDCLALPRDGLARRLGEDFIARLDRATGQRPDPRPQYSPPTVYETAQPLPAPAHEAEMLLFATRRLLTELTGFLGATMQGIQRLQLTLVHEDRTPTVVTLSLMAATRDPDHLLNVLRERLHATELPCPVVAIALRSELLLSLGARSETLLPDASRHAEAAAQLIEKLRARLGDAAVIGVQVKEDYRPEQSWDRCEPGLRAPASATESRPMWLLSQPQPLAEQNAAPCYEGRLALLAGPERIETGWWDDHQIERDYFVAANPAQSLLWIFKERQPNGRWYLHGFFAGCMLLVLAGSSWLASVAP